MWIDLVACAVTRWYLQIGPTVETDHSHRGLCMVALLNESKVEFFSPLLTSNGPGISLHRSLCLRYLGAGWVKGDAKTQLWGKKSQILWIYLKAHDLWRLFTCSIHSWSLVGTPYSPAVKMLFTFLRHRLLSSDHSWTAAFIFMEDAFTLTRHFFR